MMMPVNLKDSWSTLEDTIPINDPRSPLPITINANGDTKRMSSYEDSLAINSRGDSFQQSCRPLRPLLPRCKTYPAIVYPDLVNYFPVSDYRNRNDLYDDEEGQCETIEEEPFEAEEENDQNYEGITCEGNDQTYEGIIREGNDQTYKGETREGDEQTYEGIPCEGNDREEDVFPNSNSVPHRMHYLENRVYMSPKRNPKRTRATSLPVSAPVVNLNDLARLQGMHERAKGKKGGNRGNIGKSVLNRITKKLSSPSESMEINDACGERTDPTDTDPWTTGAPERVVFEVGPPGTNKKNNKKTFERRGLTLTGGCETKNKSSRMGQNIFKRTFSSGGASDNLLQQAIINKDLDMLDKLLAHERYLGEIDYLEPPGVSVFHQACVFGDFRVVKLLIEKGADVTLLTWSKLSALRIAVMFGHFEVAELLIDSGADLNDIKNGFQLLDPV